MRIDRGVDNLISEAMGLDIRHHFGRPSPWSHNVLLAGPYDPAKPMPIFDCTIRKDDGTVDWKMPLSNVFKKPLDQQGGIYPGFAEEYDDSRVQRFGIKFRRKLSSSDRDSIVKAGRDLQAKNYHYDIPGLFRELARFLLGTSIPPAGKLLFCSSFCQTAYCDALGDPAGRFDRAVRPWDTTDDDIWFGKGTAFPSQVPLPLPSH